jgi:ATP-dependent Clp protease protease subunit
MPLGLPKVAYELPGDPDAMWVDLYNQLYKRRLLFLGDVLDDDLANQITAAMVYLNIEDSSQIQYMYINSPGGSVLSGLSVHDMIQYVSAKVSTTCIGMAASMASRVLAGGTPGYRFALPHARMMIHQPEGVVGGQGGFIKYEYIEVGRLREKMVRVYVQRTGQPASQIEYDLDRDAFMGPEASRFYGLIDGIAQSMPDDLQN